MKRFLFIEIFIVFISALILVILDNILYQNSLFYNTCGYDNYANSEALLITCAETGSFDLGVEDWVNIGKKISSELGMNRNVLIVTPLQNKEIFNDMYCEYVTVDRIIEGDDSLIGQNIMLYNNSKGFYYEDTDTYRRRVARLPEFGYSKEDYPEYYEHTVQYRNNLNLLKPEHRYLICVDSYTVDDDNIYFVSYCAYPYFDITNSKSIPVEKGSRDRYCNYYDNEIFASNQEYIDSYLSLKRNVFEYYQIEG